MKNNNLFKNLIIFSLILVSFSIIYSCKNNEKTIDTEIEAISMSPDELLNSVKDSIPLAVKSDDELIKDGLLQHYDEDFGHNDSDIKAVGYKIYQTDDYAPGQKRAYGYAAYMEFNINDDGTLENVCGSGAAPVSIIIDPEKDSTFIYEVYTDNELNSEAFNKNFAESVRNKILERNQDDITELENNLKEMAKKIYKDKTEKDFEGEINW